jgi:crossover junction endodeoxyribonuclease RuvC
MRLLGLDPGLRKTGWGVIDAADGRLRHVANGTVDSDERRALSERLLQLFEGICAVIERHRPEAAAVEESFVNMNASSTLKLGLARGMALLAPARAGIAVAEYPTNLVKKSVVGAGHAGKEQIQAMVRRLLPAAEILGPDAADALAVAICHAHHAATLTRWHAAEQAAVALSKVPL